MLLVAVSLIGLCPVPRGFALRRRQRAQPRSADAPKTRVGAAAQQVEKGWPRSYNAPSGASIVIHQPQIASWENQKHAVGYAAVSHLACGEAEKAALGTLKIETDT